MRRDVLDEEAPEVDVILAGDCWYDARLAERVLPWLRRARARGIDILVGDPGRRYLPTDELVELASYDVRTTTELEDLERKQGRVYALRPAVENTKVALGVSGSRRTSDDLQPRSHDSREATT